ncbi:MAG: L-threonylcarbamoyladenylate synthase [Bacteroidales bacterium]|nr:L-threonylcarbamoyladenylate synthase [Bacteroidales bacterium]MDD3858692.1 L-threonylcarbamoyladenylate synthase [Bacteroidales bacterium]
MKEIVFEALSVLKKGGIILYPTDTIWGLGCDATNESAVASIYAIKQRDKSKRMLILVDSVEMLENYTSFVPDIAYKLIEVTDKPLTIIYPRAKNLAKNLIASDGSIGIRVVKNEFCQALIKELKKPITSTSANLAGQSSPLGFFAISNEIKMAADYIVPLHLEELSTAKSSDIIRINKNGQIEILR